MTSLYDMTPEDAERALHRARMFECDEIPERIPYRDEIEGTYFLETVLLGAPATIGLALSIHADDDWTLDDCWLLCIAGIDVSREDATARLDTLKVSTQYETEIDRIAREAWQS